MIRIELPAHLRTLAKVGREVRVEVPGTVTQRSVLDALEAAYPMLQGTIRDHVTQNRRPFVRFFACGEDLSHESPDAPLPEAVVSGAEPLLVVGAIAGGAAKGRAASTMTWEKSSDRLVQLFDEVAPKAANVERKKMFGWPSVFVNGNLFAGLHKESLIFRLPEEDRTQFLQMDGAFDFEPMPGRKMKGYVLLQNPIAREKRDLDRWMAKALAFASKLPAKAPAKAKETPKASAPAK